MVKRQLALFCVAVLLWPLSARTVQASSTSDLKQRLTEIPGGAIVEVKFHNQPKVRGRLGAISDSGFEVQHLKNDKMLNQTLAFQDVRSVKVVRHGWSTGTKIIVGTLAAAGVFFLILIGVYAANGGPW